MTRTRMKTMTTTPSKTGMLESNRRTMNWIIGTDLGSRGGEDHQRIGKKGRGPLARAPLVLPCRC
jgi:hypothetical protein